MGKLFSVAAAAAAWISLGGAAQAALMVQISDGVTTYTYTDNAAPDLFPSIGALVTFTSIGNFNFALTSGKSKPFIGGASRPVMDLAFDVVSNGSGGTLTIKMTDTDFLIYGASKGNCGIGGTTGGSVSQSCYYDAGNAAFATTELIGSVASVVGSDGSQLALANGLTSLTTVLTITHGAGTGVLSSGNGGIVVPEPQSLALFGIGLLGLGFLSRRRTARRLAV